MKKYKYSMRIYEIDQSTNEGVNDPGIFKAVFMAGSPGAGKSTVARMLFSNTGLRSLNVDKFWALYNKKSRTGDYEKYWELYKHQESGFLKGRLGLLIDGTAKNPTIIKDLKDRLEELGYETMMVYVDVSLENSIFRAEKRARDPDDPDFGRVVDPEFIKTTYTRIQQGVDDLRRIFGNKFYAVKNDGETPDISRIERPVRGWLRTPVTNPKAQEWIAQEKSPRRRGEIAGPANPNEPEQKTRA